MSVARAAALRAGDEVAGVYACTRKDRLTARTGSPYLALELRDRSGALPGARVPRRRPARRALRPRRPGAGRGPRRALPRRAAGRAARDRARADADPAAFLPFAYRDVEELDGFLEHLAREVHDPGYRALLEGLLDDAALRAAWRRAPCTRGGHHAYLGGLLEHTVAVGTLALETCQLHPRLNSDLLIAAALVHDLGKTREFTYGAEIGLTDEGRLLGHVALGQRLLSRGCGPGPRAPRRAAALRAHATTGRTARPGRRFGSPEALALYRLNALDAARQGRAGARSGLALASAGSGVAVSARQEGEGKEKRGGGRGGGGGGGGGRRRGGGVGGEGRGGGGVGGEGRAREGRRGGGEGERGGGGGGGGERRGGRKRGGGGPGERATRGDRLPREMGGPERAAGWCRERRREGTAASTVIRAVGALRE